jgi:casein kinase 1
MESLIYVLIHLYLGSVPWQYVEVKRDDNFVNIMNYKRTTSSQVLSLGMPNGFVKIVDYIRNLKFVDTPDYDHLKW